MGGLDDGDTAASQSSHVVLRSGVMPHFSMHSWGHNNRARRDQYGGREQIVGSACSQPRYKVCGRGRNDHCIRMLSYVDVLYLVHGFKHARGDGMAG